MHAYDTGMHSWGEESCFGIYALLQCPALLQMRAFVWEKVLQERRCAWTLTSPACDGNDCSC